MAVIQETLENGLIKHYSDEDKKLIQIETGVIYDTAVDVAPCKYTYEEADESIDDEEATETDYLQALKQLGVE